MRQSARRVVRGTPTPAPKMGGGVREWAGAGGPLKPPGVGEEGAASTAALPSAQVTPHLLPMAACEPLASLLSFLVGKGCLQDSWVLWVCQLCCSPLPYSA